MPLIAGGSFISGRYAEALSWAEKAVRANPDDILSNGTVAACAALAGRIADAGRGAARMRQLQPQEPATYASMSGVKLITAGLGYFGNNPHSRSELVLVLS